MLSTPDNELLHDNVPRNTDEMGKISIAIFDCAVMIGFELVIAL